MDARAWRRPPELPYRRDGQGRPLCRWCGKVVEPPRRWWCSEDCVEQRRLQTLKPRDRIKDRDRGVCATCGLDCERLRRLALRVRRLLLFLRHRDRIIAQFAPRSWDRIDRHYWWAHWLRGRIGRQDIGAVNVNRSFWDADHIVPVVEGGSHEIHNLRTLCIWCHRDETAKLARRRAEERAAQAVG